MGSELSTRCYNSIRTPSGSSGDSTYITLLQASTSHESTETSSASELRVDTDVDAEKTEQSKSTSVSERALTGRSRSSQLRTVSQPQAQSQSQQQQQQQSQIRTRTRRYKIHTTDSIPGAEELAEIVPGLEVKFTPAPSDTTAIFDKEYTQTMLQDNAIAKLASTLFVGRAQYCRLLLQHLATVNPEQAGSSQQIKDNTDNALHTLTLYDMIVQSISEEVLVIDIASIEANTGASFKTTATLKTVRLVLTYIFIDFPEYQPLYPTLLRLAPQNNAALDSDTIVTTIYFNAFPSILTASISVFYRKLRAQEHVVINFQHTITEYQKKLRIKTVMLGENTELTKRYKIDFALIVELLAFDFLRRILVGDANLNTVMSSLLPTFTCTSASYVRSVFPSCPGSIYAVCTNTAGSTATIPSLFQYLLNKVGIPALCARLSDTIAGNIVALEGVWYAVDTIRYVTATRFYGSDNINLPLHWYSGIFPHHHNAIASSLLPLLHSCDPDTSDTGDSTDLAPLKYNLNFIKGRCFNLEDFQDSLDWYSNLDDEVHDRISGMLDTILPAVPKVVLFNQPSSITHANSLPVLAHLTNTPLTPLLGSQLVRQRSSPVKSQTPLRNGKPRQLRTPKTPQGRTETNVAKGATSTNASAVNEDNEEDLQQELNESVCKTFTFKRVPRSTTYIQAPERMTLSQTLVNLDSEAAQTMLKSLHYMLSIGSFSLHGWILPRDCNFKGQTYGCGTNELSKSKSKAKQRMGPGLKLGAHSCNGQDSNDIKYTIHTLLERLLVEIKVSIDAPMSRTTTPLVSARPPSMGKHTSKQELSISVALSNFQIRVDQQVFYRIQFFKDTVLAKQVFVFKEHNINICFTEKLSMESDTFKSAVAKLKEHIDVLLFDNKLRLLTVIDGQNFNIPASDDEEYYLLTNLNKFIKHVFYASKCSNREGMTRKGRVILGSNGRIYLLIEFVKLL